ncbi:hypothetical protein N2152v2_010143 [Parachlorella kessleri]
MLALADVDRRRSAPILASCQSTRIIGATGPSVRLLLFSDSHIIQPQEDLDERGSNKVDRSSVLKSHQRLWHTVVDKVNAIEPAPDLAVFGGDLVHDGLFYGRSVEALLEGPFNGFQVARGILDELRVPLEMVLGNHDYSVHCGDKHQSTPRAVSREVFRHHFGIDPYYAVDVGGWRLLFLNSQLGHTWDWRHPACNTKMSSYGKRQLEWTARKLRAGRPTVVFFHFPLPSSAANEAPGARWPDLASLLAAHSNVKLAVSGHFHKGYDWQGLYPFPHITLPAVRFDSDNFLLLELRKDGTYSIPDWDKNKGGARCSEAWRYDGVVQPGGHPASGKKDCGIPLANETEFYKLPPIESLASLPKNFNPDLTCSVAMARQVLAPCLKGGNTSECCETMAQGFGPRASLLFTGCFCLPSFWQDIDGAFKDAKQDLPATIGSCAASTKTVIFHRGAGACSAPDTHAQPSLTVTPPARLGGGPHSSAHELVS